MRRAIVVAIAMSATNVARADSVSMYGGHVHFTTPSKAWAYSGSTPTGEGIAIDSKTGLLVVIFAGSPQQLLDDAEQAEADAFAYGATTLAALGGVSGLIASADSKSHKGGGRVLWVGSTCLGSILIAQQWEDGTPKKTVDQLHKVALTFSFELGSHDLFPASRDTYAGLDAAGRAAADRFASAVCSGATAALLATSSGTIELDGKAQSSKDLAAAMARVGGPAAYLRMTSGAWYVILDDKAPDALGVTRVPSKVAGDADEATTALFERTAGSWKLTKIKRGPP